MSEWESKPKKAGWFWVINEKLFSKPTPVQVRILDIDQLNIGKHQIIEWWNPKKSEWHLCGDSFRWFQAVDNVPFCGPNEETYLEPSAHGRDHIA